MTYHCSGGCGRARCEGAYHLTLPVLPYTVIVWDDAAPCCLRAVNIFRHIQTPGEKEIELQGWQPWRYAGRVFGTHLAVDPDVPMTLQERDWLYRSNEPKVWIETRIRWFWQWRGVVGLVRHERWTEQYG